MLPLVVSTALWVRSYYAVDVVSYWNRTVFAERIFESHRIFSSCQGGVLVCFSYDETLATKDEIEAYENWRQYHPKPWLFMDRPESESDKSTRYFNQPYMSHPIGFQFGRQSNAHHRVGWLSIPYWSIVIVFLLIPLFSLFSGYVATSRHANGLCNYCGYDLRATPLSCPECGWRRGGQRDDELDQRRQHRR